jgi:hypothetical protein
MLGTTRIELQNKILLHSQVAPASPLFHTDGHRFAVIRVEKIFFKTDFTLHSEENSADETIIERFTVGQL